MMSAEGLWTVQFSRSEEEHEGIQIEEQINRGGVLYLSNNRLYGGGISYYFVGTYSESASGISVTVNATKYNDIVAGPFGPVKEVRLIFNGRIDGNTMTLHGNVEDKPNMRMYVTAEKRVAL